MLGISRIWSALEIGLSFWFTRHKIKWGMALWETYHVLEERSGNIFFYYCCDFKNIYAGTCATLASEHLSQLIKCTVTPFPSIILKKFKVWVV